MELTVQQLADSDTAGVVGEQMLTVGDVKTLLAVRSARYRPGAALMYGMADMIEQIQFFPAYEVHAAEALARGLALSPEEEEYLRSETEAFARVVFFEREIRSRIPNPTLEMLRNLYEEVKDEYFATPERLLVQVASARPVDEDSSESLRALLQDMANRMNAGEASLAVFRENGFTPRSLAIHPDEEADTALVEVLRMAPDRSALSPFQADGEWFLYFRRVALPAGHVPFQSALEALGELFRYREQERLVAEYLRGIAAQPGLVRILEPNLGAEGALALDSDGLLVVAGETVTRGELRRALGWRLESIGLLDRQQFLDLVLSTGVVQERLMNHLLEEKGIRDRHEVRFFHDQLRTTMMARRVLVGEATATPLLVPDEQALNHWRFERSTAGRLPGEVSYDLLTLPSRAMSAQRREAFSVVRGAEDFRTLANELMRDEPASLWISGLRDLIGNLPEELRPPVERGDLPSLSLVEEDGQTHIYWILEAVPDESPGDEDLERARGMIRQYLLQDRIEQILADTPVDVPIRILLPVAGY